jgi:hypothetical protein
MSEGNLFYAADVQGRHADSTSAASKRLTWPKMLSLFQQLPRHGHRFLLWTLIASLLQLLQFKLLIQSRQLRQCQ